MRKLKNILLVSHYGTTEQNIFTVLCECEIFSSIKLDSVYNIQMHNNMDIYSIRYESIGL